MNNFKLGFFDLREIARFEVTSVASIGTEFSFSHNLGRTPTGYIVLSQNSAGDLYTSGTTWTDTLAYFKSDGSNVTFVVIFI